MQTYIETFTWLRFRIDLRSAPGSFWLVLGECVSGLRHLERIPLPALEGRALERELLSTGIQARLATDGISAPLDKIQGHLMPLTKLGHAGPIPDADIQAVVDTWSALGLGASTGPVGLTPDRLLEIEKSLVQGTSGSIKPGHWRVMPTRDRPWEGVPPEVIGLFVEELCDWIQSTDLSAPAEEDAHAYALIRMLVVELYMTWIRPFTTANARVAGAASLMLLAQVGMGGTAAHLAADHFQRNGKEFQRQVLQASQGMADPLPFLAFALRGIAEGLRDLHRRVREAQIQGLWRAQLLDAFSNAQDEPTRRQRQLLFDLVVYREPVPLARLQRLTPALAKAYARVSEKTLRRDIEALLSAGMLMRLPNGFLVHRSPILAFKN